MSLVEVSLITIYRDAKLDVIGSKGNDAYEKSDMVSESVIVQSDGYVEMAASEDVYEYCASFSQLILPRHCNSRL